MISARNMKITLCTLSFLSAVHLQHAVAQSRIETGFLDRTVVVAGSQYHYQVYIPFSYTPAHQWPVILFLHGSGEAGVDGLLPTQVGLGAAIRRNPLRYPAIVVFPQAPIDSAWTGLPARTAMSALEKTMQEFQTDSDRIYLTGLSLGGNGSWYLAFRYTSKFAAVAPICGWITPFAPWSRRFESVVPGDSALALKILARRLIHVPIWIFHGEEDNVVPVEHSRLAAEALKVVGANVQYTEMQGIGHNSWDPVYSSAKFATWLFAQQRRP